MEKLKQITIPTAGMKETESSLIDGYIVFVTIQYDPYCESPLDADGMGKIYSRNNRHSEYKDDAAIRDLIEDNPEAVRLSYYEHGFSRWDVAGTRDYPDAKWDSSPFGGLWVPDQSLLDNFGPEYWNMAPGTPERAAKLREIAQQSCDAYTEWRNGNCYAYSLKVYKARYEGADLYDHLDDYRKLQPVFEQSVCGFIGDDVYDGVEDAAAEALRFIGGLSDAKEQIQL